MHTYLYIDDECKVFKYEYINALRAFNIDKSIENVILSVRRKTHIKKLLRKKKYKYKVGQRKNIEALRKSSPKEFWKHFSKCKGKNVCNDISCDEFYEYFSNLENNLFSKVSNAIKSLKSNKAPGKNDLLNEYFICATNVLAPCLCELFNIVFNAGVFPDKWLEGIIIPLHEKESTTDINNFRGITLISCLAK